MTLAAAANRCSIIVFRVIVSDSAIVPGPKPHIDPDAFDHRGKYAGIS